MRIQIRKSNQVSEIEIAQTPCSVGGDGTDPVCIPGLPGQLATIHQVENIASLVSDAPVLVHGGSVPAGVTHILEVGVPVKIAPDVELMLLTAPTSSQPKVPGHTNLLFKGLLKRTGKETSEETASLLCLTGTDAGRRIPLLAEKVVLGRGHESHVIVRDRSVSRKHALITVHKNEVVIQDLASGNGIFVNGFSIKAPRHLQNGDILAMGHSLFRFETSQQQAPNSEPIASVPSEEPTQPTAHVAPLELSVMRPSFTKKEKEALYAGAALVSIGMIALAIGGLA